MQVRWVGKQAFTSSLKYFSFRQHPSETDERLCKDLQDEEDLETAMQLSKDFLVL